MKQPSEVLGVKIVGGLKETSAPWAGASLLVELFRRSGVVSNLWEMEGQALLEWQRGKAGTILPQGRTTYWWANWRRAASPAPSTEPTRPG